MFNSKPVFAAVVLFAGLLAGTTSAQATTVTPSEMQQSTTVVKVAPSPELAAYLASLTPELRADFVNTKMPATQTVVVSQAPTNLAASKSASDATITGAVLSPTAVGCWTGRADWSLKALGGNILYTYYHVGRWCSSGSTVTSAAIADKGAQIFTVGWRYAGVTASGSGVVSNQGR